MSSDLIDRYLSYLRAETRSANTIKDRRRTLLAMDRDLPYGLETACEDEIKQWLWRDGLSLNTRETYYGAVASFFRWAVQHEGIFDFDPTMRISRPKPPRMLPNPVTDEELHHVLSNAREPYLTWAKIGAYAGGRCLDISQLHRERITQGGTTFLNSKGGKSRVVPTHPIVWDAVKDLPPGPITDMTPRQISMSARSYFTRTLGLRGVRMHRLRHWFGTMVQRLYKDLRVTQELMGHEDPATTAGYALVAAEQGRAAIDLLPVFGAWADAETTAPRYASAPR